MFYLINTYCFFIKHISITSLFLHSLRNRTQYFLYAEPLRLHHKISWTAQVKDEGVLQRVDEKRNILRTMKRRNANRIEHILHRNSFLKHDIVGNKEGRMKATWGRRRRRKQLLGDLKERRGYCKLKEEVLDRTLWRTRSGRGCEPVVRQITLWLVETTALTFVARVKEWL